MRYLIFALFVLTSLSFTTKPECHEKLDQFGKVEIFGSFAYDLGCRYSQMKIDGKNYDYKEGTTILAKRIVKREKTNLLIELIDVVYLQHSSVMTQEGDNFTKTKSKFQSPECKKVESGYSIKAWIHEPAQSQPIEHFSLMEFEISPDGVILKKVIQSHSVDL